MPIYEYDCQSCGKKTEVIQRFREKPLKICPHCGGKLKKAFSAPAIQFKGSGWYVTDYPGARGEQKTKEAAADSKEGSAETAEKSEKSEKTEKTDKTEKTERTEKTEKTEKPKSPKSKVQGPK